MKNTLFDCKLEGKFVVFSLNNVFIKNNEYKNTVFVEY